ncbi:hypothetical protein E2C01_072523 [Portunus trituberculatus]|uniref:Uncharacterized protein n=1 Tax=Portunus trituberculatus TaxID=210409 RepID=A0A5B7I824_PORTR|nr:hypothetical protein [Portunus trituberculatus]
MEKQAEHQKVRQMDYGRAREG